MAISREGTLVSSISGTLGSVVFYQGARAGVIGMRPSGSKSQSEDQQKRRAALIFAQKCWRENYSNNQKKWCLFARSFPWTNRIGVRRNISGYNAYLAYIMRIWPYGFPAPFLIQPPLAITTPLPTLASVSFTRGGPFNITTSAVPIPLTAENLTLTQGLNYGNRTSKGSVHYCGYKSIYNTTQNWYTQITALGITLNAGDIIKLRIFWYNGVNWPTQDVEVITEVL